MCADTEHSQIPRRKWNLTLRKALLSVKPAMSWNCAKYHQQKPILGFYCCSVQEIPSLSPVCPWRRYWSYPMYVGTCSFLINSHKVKSKYTQIAWGGKNGNSNSNLANQEIGAEKMRSEQLEKTPEPTSKAARQNTSTEELHSSFPHSRIFSYSSFLESNFAIKLLKMFWLIEISDFLIPEHVKIDQDFFFNTALYKTTFNYFSLSFRMVSFCFEFDDKQKINKRLPLPGIVPQLHWDRRFVKISVSANSVGSKTPHIKSNLKPSKQSHNFLVHSQFPFPYFSK